MTLPAHTPALPSEFYARPTLTVARELLGARLCHRLPDGTLHAGRIVEVEAYLGPEDKASHARLQRRRGGLFPTPRSALMFGPVGRAYVYLIYGIHSCFNVVAHADGAVGAVLIRALSPEPPLLPPSCRGPAKLCVALAIDRRYNGCLLSDTDLPPTPGITTPTDPPVAAPTVLPPGDHLWIAAGAPVPDTTVTSGPRIGVDYAGADALLPYRLSLHGDPHLSRPA